MIRLHPSPPPGPDDSPPGLAELLGAVAKGDTTAFARVYDELTPAVYGTVLRVLRDPAQSEEVAQEVMVEIWRQASRYSETKGSVRSWVITIAHRRAVDRVRSAQASTDRDHKVGVRDQSVDYDAVVEEVEHRLEHEQVRRALAHLTELQKEAVTLAYYGGYTHREVAELLQVPLGTVKTRLRDGMIRLRDTLGVAS